MRQAQRSGKEEASLSVDTGMWAAHGSCAVPMCLSFKVLSCGPHLLCSYMSVKLPANMFGRLLLHPVRDLYRHCYVN
uniref:Uncharacterized protein n=1 Tax=Oryza punctata TaxID=4537 RepID=A0A0E0JZC0_ORYPU